MEFDQPCVAEIFSFLFVPLEMDIMLIYTDIIEIDFMITLDQLFLYFIHIYIYALNKIITQMLDLKLW